MDRARCVEPDEAVAAIGDGSTLYLGGAVLRRKPIGMVRALAAAGRRALHVMSFAGSLDIDILVGGGCVRTVSSAYVGLGHAGAAPHFRRAVQAGEIEDREYSEWTLLGGIRAAAMGLPFMPTRGGTGSELLSHLGILEVDDPYGTGRYLAVPPISPDVTVLHAWRASAAGAVQMARPPEHLWDIDVAAARAARRVIVTVEDIVDDHVILESPDLTVLLPAEVDMVVEWPGGSWPTAGPPILVEDHHAIEVYARTGILPERRAVLR